MSAPTTDPVGSTGAAPPKPGRPRRLPSFLTSVWTRLGVLFVLVVAAGGVWTLAARQAPAAPPTVAFIGDSYTGGSDMGGNGDHNYTEIVARRLGWSVVNTAVGGTGYVKRSDNARPFEEQQLRAVVAVRPALVVIVGSRNDIDEDPKDVTTAAEQLYDHIRSALPYTKIVVVGPIWPGGPPPAIDAIRSAVLTAAAARNVPVIDPIADHWFDDGVPGLIGRDGVHPNDAGHAYIADLMIIALQRTITISR